MRSGAAALTIRAGLEGVKAKLEPGNPHTDNMYMKTPAELAELGIHLLPRTLEEALDASALPVEQLGETLAWLFGVGVVTGVSRPDGSTGNGNQA